MRTGVKATAPDKGCWRYHLGERPEWYYNGHFRDIECKQCGGGCAIQTIRQWPKGFIMKTPIEEWRERVKAVMVKICLQENIELLILPDPPDHLFTGTGFAFEDMVGAYATLMEAGVIDEEGDLCTIEESWQWQGSLEFCMHGRKWEDCPECDRSNP